MSFCILFSVVHVVINSYQLQALNRNFPQHFHRFQVSILPETSLTSIAQNKIKLSSLFFVLNSFIQATLRIVILWEVILQTIWFAATILKGIPLNVQTKTVLSIHDPVKGYCLQWLLVIYL
jgi:hypothetical protein